MITARKLWSRTEGRVLSHNPSRTSESASSVLGYKNTARSPLCPGTLQNETRMEVLTPFLYRLPRKSPLRE